MIELKIRVPGGALSKTSVSYGTWQKYEIIKRNHILFRSIPTDCIAIKYMQNEVFGKEMTVKMLRLFEIPRSTKTIFSSECKLHLLL